MSDSQSSSEYSPAKNQKPERSSKSAKGSLSKQNKDSTSKAKKEQVSKGKKGKPAKNEKKEKNPKVKEKVPKRKEAKSKGKPKETGNADVKELVFDYLSKQNRPYNLLNIFDNLHSEFKKPILESVLTELTDEGRLTCKQFGKNKVYFANQSTLKVNIEQVDEMAKQCNELRQIETQLANRYKNQMQQLKKLLAKKKVSEIQQQIRKARQNIQTLSKKKGRLTNLDAEKIDPAKVEAIEKDQFRLKKELNKRRRLTKDLLKTWSEILQKKVEEVAEIMGVEL